MKKAILVISIITLLCHFIQAQFATDTVSQSVKMAYTQLANYNMYSRNYWLFGDVRSDVAEVGGDFLGEIPEMEEVMFHEADETNENIRSYWYRGFNTIFFCNYAIENAHLVSELNQQEQDRLISEARFIRSLMYFNLVNAFDSLPIQTEIFYWPIDESSLDYLSDNYLTGPFNKMSEVYSLIKADLKSAIEYLPHRSGLDNDNRFRATKEAAMALLGKVYLFESSFAKNYPDDERFSGMETKWDSALFYNEEVISSGEHSLVGGTGESFNTWWDSSPVYPGNTPAFRYIFTVDGNGSPEIVFPAINMTPGQGWVSYGGNWIVQWTTARYVIYEGIDYAFGWGCNVPSQHLIDLFASESGNPVNDPRFTVTVGREGDSILYTVNGSTWVEMGFPAAGYPNTACRKYECSPDEYWNIVSHGIDGPIDIPVIRFSDVLLMAAEAALELGNNIKASEYINLVRTRARNSGSTGYPEDITVISLNDIIHERALEFALEGHRFYDLVRWGIAYEVLDGRCIGPACSTSAVFEEGIDEFLPIPAGAVGIPDYISKTDDFILEIYPNPANDFLVVNSNNTDIKISICDLQGRIMLEGSPDKKNNCFDIHSLNPGLYIVRVFDQGNKATIKIIKE